MRILSALALLIASSVSALAQSGASLLPQLREMNALFLSPYTVDVGHVQVETYLVGYAYSHDTSDGANTRTSIWNIAPTTLKYGTLTNLDLELQISPYTHVRTEDRIAGSVERQRGFGAVRLKAKVNLWGNDSGSSAVGLVPFIKLPTAQDGLANDAYEGGVAVPVALELPRGWWVFLTPEFSLAQGSEGKGYTPAFFNTTCLWHQIVGVFSGYAEFASGVAADAPEQWYGTVDAGCTYMLTHNIQLDAGVLVGVTKTAPDVNPFLGLSFRF